MHRKAYEKMRKWKQRNRETALLIQGARRVGKSYLVKKFARDNYKSYILIDFNKAEQQIKDLFFHDLNDLDSFGPSETTP